MAKSSEKARGAALRVQVAGSWLGVWMLSAVLALVSPSARGDEDSRFVYEKIGEALAGRFEALTIQDWPVSIDDEPHIRKKFRIESQIKYVPSREITSNDALEEAVESYLTEIVTQLYHSLKARPDLLVILDLRLVMDLYGDQSDKSPLPHEQEICWCRPRFDTSKLAETPLETFISSLTEDSKVGPVPIRCTNVKNVTLRHDGRHRYGPKYVDNHPFEMKVVVALREKSLLGTAGRIFVEVHSTEYYGDEWSEVAEVDLSGLEAASHLLTFPVTDRNYTYRVKIEDDAGNSDIVSVAREASLQPIEVTVSHFLVQGRLRWHPGQRAARVTVERRSDTNRLEARMEVETDREGRFHFFSLPGPHELTVEVPSRSLKCNPIVRRIDRERPAVELELNSGAITGNVRGVKPARIESRVNPDFFDLQVRAVHEDNVFELDKYQELRTTDLAADGSFNLGCLQPGAWKLSVRWFPGSRPYYLLGGPRTVEVEQSVRSIDLDVEDVSELPDGEFLLPAGDPAGNDDPQWDKKRLALHLQSTADGWTIVVTTPQGVFLDDACPPVRNVGEAAAGLCREVPRRRVSDGFEHAYVELDQNRLCGKFASRAAAEEAFRRAGRARSLQDLCHQIEIYSRR